MPEAALTAQYFDRYERKGEQSVLDTTKTATTIHLEEGGGFTLRCPGGQIQVPKEIAGNLDRCGRDHYFALMYGLPPEQAEAWEYFMELVGGEK